MITTTEKIEALERFRPQLERLKESAANAIKPRTRVTVSSWATSTIRLSRAYEATAGPYDTTNRPWWNEVLDACLDPEVDTVDIMAATQVGKTLSMLIAALAMSDINPVPGLVCTPDRDSAVELRDRIYALASGSPKLRSRVPREADWNNRHIDLKTCRLYIAYSGARQRLRGRPCGWMLLSEIDVYRGDSKGGDPIAAAGERVKAFFRSTIICESSPGDDPSPIGQRYDQSDARKWHGRCPHCKTSQEVRFYPYKAGSKAGRGGVAGYRDDDGKLLSADDARVSAHYVCVNGCKITNADKDEFLLSGRWVPRGQHVDKKGKLCGIAERSGRARGYHLWSIMSPSQNFGSIAAAFIDHYHRGQLADFLKNWLGLPHTTRDKMPEWNKLGSRLSGKHTKGTVPADAWFLTAGIDVQGDRVYWVVRAWGDSTTSWLVDWGHFDRDIDENENVVLKSDLVPLVEHVLSKKWPVVDQHRRPTKSPHGLPEMGIKLAGIDSNYRVLDVHEWLRSLPPNLRARIRAIRGDHKLNSSEPYRRNVLYESQSGEVKYEGGLEQWGIYVNLFKQDLAERFNAPRGVGAFYFTSDVLVTGTDYLKQLVNEPKVVEKDSAGKVKVIWKEKNHHIGHDFWDTEVYARAIAQMIVNELAIGWDSSKWPRVSDFDAPIVNVAEPQQVNVVARDEYYLER
jgi:phage terminase large subunit GpA-like protein